MFRAQTFNDRNPVTRAGAIRRLRDAQDPPCERCKNVGLVFERDSLGTIGGREAWTQYETRACPECKLGNWYALNGVSDD